MAIQSSINFRHVSSKVCQTYQTNFFREKYTYKSDHFPKSCYYYKSFCKPNFIDKCKIEWLSIFSLLLSRKWAKLMIVHFPFPSDLLFIYTGMTQELFDWKMVNKVFNWDLQLLKNIFSQTFTFTNCWISNKWNLLIP